MSTKKKFTLSREVGKGKFEDICWININDEAKKTVGSVGLIDFADRKQQARLLMKLYKAAEEFFAAEEQDNEKTLPTI